MKLEDAIIDLRHMSGAEALRRLVDMFGVVEVQHGIDKLHPERCDYRVENPPWAGRAGRMSQYKPSTAYTKWKADWDKQKRILFHI